MHGVHAKSGVHLLKYCLIEMTYLCYFESLLVGLADHIDVDQVALRGPHIVGKYLDKL